MGSEIGYLWLKVADLIKNAKEKSDLVSVTIFEHVERCIKSTKGDAYNKDEIIAAIKKAGIEFKVDEIDDKIKWVKAAINLKATYEVIPGNKNFSSSHDPLSEDDEDGDIAGVDLDDLPLMIEESSKSNGLQTEHVKNDTAPRTYTDILTDDDQECLKIARDDLKEEQKAAESDKPDILPVIRWAGLEKPQHPIVALGEYDDILAELEKQPNSLPMVLKENSDEAKADRFPSYLRCTIQYKDQTTGILPREDPDGNSINCTIHIEDVKRDPKIVVRVKVLGPDKQELRTANAEFLIGHDKDTLETSDVVMIKGLRQEEVKDHLMKGRSGKMFAYKFVYRACYVHGTGNLDALPKSAHEAIKALQNIQQPQPGTTEYMIVQLYGFGTQGLNNLQEMDAAFKNHEQFGRNMGPYRTNVNVALQGDFNYLVSREQVYHHAKGIYPMQKRMAFRTNHDAALRQNVAARNEYLAHEARRNLMLGAFHHAGFRIVNHDHGIMYLRADVSLLVRSGQINSDNEAVATVPMSTEELEAVVRLREKDRHFRGILIHNPDPSVKATFQVHLQSIPDDFMDYAQTPDEEVIFHKAKVYLLDESKKNTRLLNANMAFWSYHEFADIRTVLLGQRLHEVIEHSPAPPSCGLHEQSRIKQKALAGIKNAAEEQKNIVEHMWKVPGRIGVISGPGGCGKSEVMGVMAAGYAQAGLHVLGVSQTNNAADTLHAKFCKYCSLFDLEKPCRMYSEGDEINWLINGGKRLTREPNKDLDIYMKGIQPDYGRRVANLDAVRDAKRNRRFQFPENSVAQNILVLYVAESKPLMIRESLNQKGDNYDYDDGRFHDPEDPQYNEVREPPKRELIDGVAKYNELLKKGDEKGQLPEEIRKEFFYVCCQLIRAFIATQKVIVTTIGNSDNKLIRNSFATNSKGMTLFVDEASTAREIDVNQVVAKLVPLQRWKKEFGDRRDMWKCIWLGGDTRQLAPFVLNRDHNEFVAQLSTDYLQRLTKVGHKVFHLTQSHRHHEQIFNIIVNGMIYDSSLTMGPDCRANLPTRQHTKEQQEFMIEYLRLQSVKMPPTMTEANIKVEHEKLCHLFFIHVPKGEEIANNSGSKLNLQNAAVYIDFIKQALFDKKLWKPKEWAYMSPYVGQVQLVRTLVNDLLGEWNQNHPNNQKTLLDVPDIIVADAAQSREFNNVWYDTTSSNKKGFLTEDTRAATHLTRGRNTLLIIGNKGLWSGCSPSAKKANKVGEERPMFPLIARAINTLVGRGFWVSKNVQVMDKKAEHLVKLYDFPFQRH